MRSYKLNKLGLDKIIDKEMESLNELRKMIRKTQRDIDKLERMRGM